MKTLTLYGYSDDLVEVRGDFGHHEHPRRGGQEPCLAATFALISAASGRIRIHAIYDGCWGFAVTSDDHLRNYRTMPDWPIRRTFGEDCPYSETLIIDAPDDATFERCDKSDDDVGQ